MARIPPEFREFAKLRPDVEAVIQRVGRDTFDCLLIDVGGNWVRAIFPSQDDAARVCRHLGIPAHRGWEDPRLARRMSRSDVWSNPGERRRAL